MKHLKTFENFDTTNEDLKDKLKLVGGKIKDKVSKLRNLKWSDIKSYGNKLWDSVKRESKETKQAAGILKKMLDGEEVSENEKKFLKEQSKDLVRIIGTSALPMPITAVLVALGKKYKFDVFPGSQEELKSLIEKEKQELGVTIDEEESPQ
jgi:hypothetical protein